MRFTRRGKCGDSRVICADSALQVESEGEVFGVVEDQRSRFLQPHFFTIIIVRVTLCPRPGQSNVMLTGPNSSGAH